MHRSSGFPGASRVHPTVHAIGPSNGGLSIRCSGGSPLHNKMVLDWVTACFGPSAMDVGTRSVWEIAEP